MKQHGELKPWAPSKSYGLVVRLDGASTDRELPFPRQRHTSRRHKLPVSGASVIVAAKGGDGRRPIAR